MQVASADAVCLRPSVLPRTFASSDDAIGAYSSSDNGCDTDVGLAGQASWNVRWTRQAVTNELLHAVADQWKDERRSSGGEAGQYGEAIERGEDRRTKVERYRYDQGQLGSFRGWSSGKGKRCSLVGGACDSSHASFFVQDRFNYIVNAIVNVLYLFYHPVEHIAWLSNFELVPVDPNKWWTYTMYIWTAALIFSIAR